MKKKSITSAQLNAMSEAEELMLVLLIALILAIVGVVALTTMSRNFFN